MGIYFRDILLVKKSRGTNNCGHLFHNVMKLTLRKLLLFLPRSVSVKLLKPLKVFERKSKVLLRPLGL